MKGTPMKLKIQPPEEWEARIDKLIRLATTALCLFAVSAGLFLLGMISSAN
jgi:hypothetical protein